MLGLLLAAVGTQAFAAKPFEIDALETKDLRLLYFDPFETYLVPHATRAYENSFAFQKKMFGWEPYDRPTVVLQDFSDYGGGAAVPSPYNLVLLDIAPKNHTLETTPGNERFFMLMNHEMTHIATLDIANQQDLFWRKFFHGKVQQTDDHPESILYNYLTVPRLSSPRWYGEGSAVFMETWMAGGIGRSQGAYDEMVFRAMVRDNAPFYSALGLVSEGTEVDFQVGANAYLYGTRFFSYLAYQYSPEQVIRWLRRDPDSKRYYASQFKHVFGKDLEDAWQDWIEFEHHFQDANLARVREVPLTPTTPLVPKALGSISRAFIDPATNELVAGFRYPGVVAHIGAVSLDTGRERRLEDIKGPMLYRVTSTAFDPSTRTLFYTTDNPDYRDLVALDLATGKSRQLIKDGRIGDLAFDPADGSLWGLRHLNGYVTLVHIPPPYTEWNQVFTWDQGQVAFELDVSPDGKLLSVSVGEVTGRQYLRVYRLQDLAGEHPQPYRSFDFGTAIPEGFVFSPDGRYLFGSSYYTGVSNIFRYELATGDLEAVSNAETGFFRPMPLANGKLLVFEFTGQGFLPVEIDPVPLQDLSSVLFLGNEIVKKHPVVKDWSVVKTLRDQPFEEIVTARYKYRPYQHMGFTSGYPVLLGYRNDLALGYSMRVSDPTTLHHVDITAGYSWDSPSNQQLHFDIRYEAVNWWLRYWHNYADFYDLFGPTERARKGDAFFVGYDRPLIYDLPRRLDLHSEVAWYTGLDTLPDAQNRPTFLIDKILTARTSLEYEYIEKSLGAVDHEKGWQWLAEARVDHSEFDTIPKLRGGINFGFALPWKHASVWFYNQAGWADGNRLDPLTNYYFGGFGNNYVDDGDVKRYREYYSMPGFEINEVGAREFGKVTAEFNFPPIRFREAGRPGFFLKHIRPSLFASRLITDPGKVFERNLTSLGVQLDLEFTMVHRLPMTLSAGWGVGYEDGKKHDDEWMLSLKIL